MLATVRIAAHADVGQVDRWAPHLRDDAHDAGWTSPQMSEMTETPESRCSEETRVVYEVEQQVV
jgi:hypothetical protein